MSKITQSMKRKKKLVYLWEKNRRCHYCQRKTTLNNGGSFQATFDHKVPKKEGGLDTWANAILSCYECNSLKGHKSYNDYMNLVKGFEPSMKMSVYEYIYGLNRGKRKKMKNYQEKLRKGKLVSHLIYRIVGNPQNPKCTYVYEDIKSLIEEHYRIHEIN